MVRLVYESTTQMPWKFLMDAGLKSGGPTHMICSCNKCGFMRRHKNVLRVRSMELRSYDVAGPLAFFENLHHLQAFNMM